MFEFKRKGKRFISWGFHELAWSLRTSGFSIYVLDAEGKVLDKFYSTKRAGNREIPHNTKYVVRTYETNSGYRQAYIYKLDKKPFEKLTEQIIDIDNTEEVEKLDEAVKSFIYEIRE